MYGLEAIKASNGWEISSLGISIVFTGLILLSIAIGQIHKLLALWENRHTIQLFRKNEPKQEVAPPLCFTQSQKIRARQFMMLIKTPDDPFSLPKLLALAEVSGLEAPHTSLGTLLDSGIIVSDANGFFVWDKDRFTQLTS